MAILQPMTREEYMQKYGVEPFSNTTLPKEMTTLPQGGGFLGGVAEFGKGVLKGAGQSLYNIGNITEDVARVTGIGKLVDKVVPGEPVQQLFRGEPEILKAKNVAQKAGKVAETIGELVLTLPTAGASMIQKAQRIYQSALKPSTTLSAVERLRVLRTGLDEGITLTKGGIQKTADLITDLETKLGESIKKLGQEGKTIPTVSLREYVNEAKKFFQNTADVKFSSKAVSQLDSMVDDFIKKYGKDIPIDVAQQVKTNTYRLIRSHYDKLSAPAIEGSKQIARGLKEGVVKVGPQIGNINERLADLYNFEEQLSRASGRLGNLNIISLGSKVLSTAGGKVGAGLSLVNEIFGSATSKTFGAIQLNKIGKFLSTQSPAELEQWKKVAKFLGPVNLTNFIKGITNVEE